MTSNAAGIPSQSRRASLRLATIFAAILLVTAALMTWKFGARSWPFLIGAALLSANRLGWLERWQQDASRRWLGRLATGMFLTSLVLPGVQGCKPPLRGWQIAWATLRVEGELVYKAATSNADRAKLGEAPYESGRILVLLTGYNLVNVLLATAAFAPWSWGTSMARVFPAAAIAGASTIWAVSAREPASDYLLGWWIAVAASYLLASLMKPPWFTLVIPPLLFALFIVMQLPWQYASSSG
ncbi:MAG: hypothetical protein U0939_04540 [Pirellulales bacterium]